MKLVQYDTLVPDMLLIQPHIAWLLGNVPKMLSGEDAERVVNTLEDLAVKYARLQGKILELEVKVEEFDDDTRNVLLLEDGEMSIIAQGSVNACLVVSVTTDTIAGFETAEDCLREALAETIVRQGEMVLEKEARYAKATNPFNIKGVTTGRMSGHHSHGLERGRAMATEHEVGYAEALDAIKATLTTKAQRCDPQLRETVTEHPEAIDQFEMFGVGPDLDPCPSCDKPGAPGQPACTGCRGFTPKERTPGAIERAWEAEQAERPLTLEDYLRHAQEMTDMAVHAESVGATVNAKMYRDAADLAEAKEAIDPCPGCEDQKP